MKKVTFFIGRKHHAQKLSGIALYGQENGLFEPHFLIADNAVNIDPPSEFIWDFGVTNIHHSKGYVYAAPDQKSVRETIKALPLEELFMTVTPFWTAYSVREALEVVHGFGGYLFKQRPDAVFVLHPQNFWAKILLYLATELGIKTYSLQEGILLEREERDMGRFSGSLKYVHRAFSWSEHDLPLFGSSADKVVPVGPPHLDKYLSMDREQRDSAAREFLPEFLHGTKKVISVFAPPRSDLYAGDINTALHELSKFFARTDSMLVLRPHPFEGNIDLFKKYADRYESVKLYTGEDTAIALMSARVVFTQTSTVALESLALGTPSVLVDFDGHGQEQRLPFCGAIGSKDDLYPVISEAISESGAKKTAEKRADILPLADGLSTKRIAEAINEG